MEKTLCLFHGNISNFYLSYHPALNVCLTVNRIISVFMMIVSLKYMSKFNILKYMSKFNILKYMSKFNILKYMSKFNIVK